MTLLRRAAALGVLLGLGCAGMQGERLGSGTGAATGGVAADEAGRENVYVGMAGGEVALIYLDVASGTHARRAAVSVGRPPATQLRSEARESQDLVHRAT